jgi:pimeloyl-ACP methyl ester carboxylesterase
LFNYKLKRGGNLMPTVKVNGIDVYYEIHGKGEPLIIIQWAGVEITSISRLITEFAKNYKVTALDNRGVGRTDMPDMPYSIEMMAEDTIGLMDEMGIKSAHFIGISMGSRIAQVIGVKYPERVKSLILNVAAARYPDPLKSITDTSLEDPYLREKMLQESGIMFMQKYSPNPESFLRQIKAMSDFDGRKQLSQIKASTLIVNGTKDHFVPMGLTEELASGIKGSKLILIEGNHFFAAIEPELLIGPALEFLEEIRAKSALKA